MMKTYSEQSRQVASKVKANSNSYSQNNKSGSHFFTDKRATTAIQRQIKSAANATTLVQKHALEDEEFDESKLHQRKLKSVQQQLSYLQSDCSKTTPPMQKTSNKTGLPDNLKLGMENLSGMSLDHVKVHYNSAKPAAVQAHAYAQGSEIHLGSGQEKHLPHELGHVVQQAQGRVQATTNVDGVAVNDNPSLENEATELGNKALQRATNKKHLIE